MEDQLFSEKQSFRQAWLWLSLSVINLIYIIKICAPYLSLRVIKGENNGVKGTIISAVILIITTFLIYMLRLETIIKTDGNYYRFYPFQIKLKKISWEDVSHVSIRKYYPIMEYGGWGLRYEFLRSGKAYNVSGYGLQLIFTDKKRFLIGTQKANEIKTILFQLGKISEAPKD